MLSEFGYGLLYVLLLKTILNPSSSSCHLPSPCLGAWQKNRPQQRSLLLWPGEASPCWLHATILPACWDAQITVLDRGELLSSSRLSSHCSMSGEALPPIHTTCGPYNQPETHWLRGEAARAHRRWREWLSCDDGACTRRSDWAWNHTGAWVEPFWPDVRAGCPIHRRESMCGSRGFG